MSKQTAVEWLVNEIIKHDKSFAEYYGAEIEQAKEMEKQQIIDAYTQGSDDLEKSEYLPFKYYNETYNK